jgi:hypothetical protein
MSQKSSFLQPANSVSQVLIPDNDRQPTICQSSANAAEDDPACTIPGTGETELNV